MTVSFVQSILVAVETISIIKVQTAQHRPIVVSCMKDIGSASVTGSADCLPILQKMVDDVSRAKQALPSEFTSAAAQAPRVTLGRFREEGSGLT